MFTVFWNIKKTHDNWFPWKRCNYKVGTVFANGPGDRGSIPGQVMPKTLKLVLDTSLFNTQQYNVRIEGKVEQSRERSCTPPTPQCSCYWKGSPLVALDYGRQLYLQTVLPIVNTFAKIHLIYLNYPRSWLYKDHWWCSY